MVDIVTNLTMMCPSDHDVSIVPIIPPELTMRVNEALVTVT